MFPLSGGSRDGARDNGVQLHRNSKQVFLRGHKFTTGGK